MRAAAGINIMGAVAGTDIIASRSVVAAAPERSPHVKRRPAGFGGTAESAKQPPPAIGCHRVGLSGNGRPGVGQILSERLICPMVENVPASKPDPEGSQEEQDLVLAAMAGQRFAFQQLIARYEEKIYRMIFFRTRSRLDAEDICQEVFIQAFKNLNRLKDPARFAGWLYRIAANRVKDHYRKKRVRAIFSFLPDVEREADATTAIDEGTGVMENLERQEFWSKVQNMLGRLSQMEREVFLLRFFDDLGIREISEVIDKSQSTVKTHLYRALKKFKDDEAFRDFLREAVS